MKNNRTHDIERFDISDNKAAIEMVNHIFSALSNGSSIQIRNDEKSGLVYIDTFSWRRLENENFNVMGG